jgi:hypothetical protein
VTYDISIKTIILMANQDKDNKHVEIWKGNRIRQENERNKLPIRIIRDQ